MPKRASTTVEPSRAALAVKMRRTQLGLSQEELAYRTQMGKPRGDKTTLSQRTVSDIEKGNLALESLSAARLSSLITALEWSFDTFFNTTAAALPGFNITMQGTSSSSGTIKLGTSPPPSPTVGRNLTGFVRLRVITASAGFGKDSESSVVYRDVPEEALEGGKPEDHMLVDVVGSSMSCDDVRLSILEGTSIIINTIDEPQAMDIVVCKLFYEDEWFIVLKIFDDRKHVVLHSYNEEYPPIVLQEGMQLERIGVYVNRLGPSRKAMRQMNRARLRGR